MAGLELLISDLCLWVVSSRLLLRAESGEETRLRLDKEGRVKASEGRLTSTVCICAISRVRLCVHEGEENARPLSGVLGKLGPSAIDLAHSARPYRRD